VPERDVTAGRDPHCGFVAGPVVIVREDDGLQWDGLGWDDRGREYETPALAISAGLLTIPVEESWRIEEAPW